MSSRRTPIVSTPLCKLNVGYLISVVRFPVSSDNYSIESMKFDTCQEFLLNC